MIVNIPMLLMIMEKSFQVGNDANRQPLYRIYDLGWKKTAMKNAVDIFDEFLAGLEAEARNKLVAKRGL